MDNFFRAIAFLGAMVGALVLITTLGMAESAPQQAAGAAIALALAAIPYCMSRLLHDGYEKEERAKRHAHLASLLDDTSQPMQTSRSTRPAPTMQSDHATP